MKPVPPYALGVERFDALIELQPASRPDRRERQGERREHQYRAMPRQPVDESRQPRMLCVGHVNRRPVGIRVNWVRPE